VTSLFIGLVSHEKSRFAQNQGPEGLTQTLAWRLGEMGVATSWRVNTEDAYDSAALPIDGKVAWGSVSEELRLESRWQRFLGAGRPDSAFSRVGRSAHMGLRYIRAFSRYWRPWQPAGVSDSDAQRLVRRLINIEISHLTLMRAGLASGADWVLIIEDDASTLNLEDCAAGLRGLMNQGSVSEPVPAYVNVSQSFTNAELGVEHLLTLVEGTSWAGNENRALLSASRPITNTVCAILYRSSFLSALVKEMEALPMTPVVPIDWKLNIALMNMFESGALTSGDCWNVTPGPMDQLSMR
jgi:hypothetical protein